MNTNEVFDGSFKIYVDPIDGHTNKLLMQHENPNACTVDIFAKEVDCMKEDVKRVDELYKKLQELNEEIKDASNTSKTMKDIKARIHMELDHLIKLAKQINRKFDGLVMANAAQRRVSGSGPGSSDDQARASMISSVAESLNQMRRRFQGFRSQMEKEHRHIMENKYFSITKEKATSDAIDQLIACDVHELTILQLAMQEHGRGPVLEAVAEIKERREIKRDIRNTLTTLHQILLDIAHPVVVEIPAREGFVSGLHGPASHVEPAIKLSPSATNANNNRNNTHNPLVVSMGLKTTARAQLTEYEMQVRRTTYIGVGCAFVIVVVTVILAFMVELKLSNVASNTT